MMGKTHISAGMITAIGMATTPFGQGEPLLAVLSLVTLGAILPDIDLPESTIGRRLFFISIPINRLAGHRGITHSLLPYALLLTALYFFTPTIWFYCGVLLCAGVLSHLFLDMLNPRGIPILYPYKKQFRILKIRTGGRMENIFALGLLISFIYIAINVFSG